MLTIIFDHKNPEPTAYLFILEKKNNMLLDIYSLRRSLIAIKTCLSNRILAEQGPLTFGSR